MDNRHVADYKIYRGGNAFFVPAPDNLITTVDEITSYKDNDLKFEHEYYYRITAVDVAGNEGPVSKTAHAHVPVGDLFATDFEDENETRWQVVEGAWEIRGGEYISVPFLAYTAPEEGGYSLPLFPFSIFDPKPHVLKAVVKGAHIDCYVDGCLIMEVDDQTFSHGSVGLFCPNAWMRYDNFSVSSQ